MARRRPDRNRTPREEEPPKPDAHDESESAPPAWLERASQRYEQRQQGYASLLSDARESVQRNRENLSNMLHKEEKSADEDPPPPPLFEQAANAYHERQQSLASLFDDAVAARAKEKEALSKLFGDRTTRRPRAR